MGILSRGDREERDLLYRSGRDRSASTSQISKYRSQRGCGGNKFFSTF
ncbi:hypothetical protein [Myxosarcina sp. GI1]|nr:hypothetical protein [Myxosarcina sp. GI1]